MRSRAIVVAGIGLLAARPGLAQEPDWYELTARRQTDGVRSVEALIQYAVGELRVFPGPDDLLYDIHMRYDARTFEPRRSWSNSAGVGQLRLDFESSRGDSHWNLGDFDHHGSDHGFLALGLSPEVPVDLTLEVGVAVGRLELGGIALSHLDYKTGAAETRVRFDSPNPITLEHMELAAGAASFEAIGLGNARFEALTFAGAVGEVVLDFSGEWDRNATAEITVGLGALTLRFPRDLGVRIEKRGLLAALDSQGMERVDGAFRTANWESAPYRLEIALKTVLGAIDVEFVR